MTDTPDEKDASLEIPHGLTFRWHRDHGLMVQHGATFAASIEPAHLEALTRWKANSPTEQDKAKLLDAGLLVPVTGMAGNATWRQRDPEREGWAVIASAVHALQTALEVHEVLDHERPGRLVTQAFTQELAVRSATEIVVRHHDNGFFANFMAVLDVLAVRSPGSLVCVDWTLNGSEEHFPYGDAGTNVWNRLFEPLAPASLLHDPLVIERRLTPLSENTGRDMLQASTRWESFRRERAEVMKRYVRLTNTRCVSEIEAVKKRFENKHVIGVHRRTPSVIVAANQLDGRLPTIEDFIAATRVAQQNAGDRETIIFVATDDPQAVDAYREEFGNEVFIRDGITRLAENEAAVAVNTRGFKEVTFKDAEDVVIDTWCLGLCDELLHISSNIVTTAAYLNPDLVLVRL